jgi:aryl-alcohol dehydrogenase-like predicted oxidoreductase
VEHADALRPLIPPGMTMPEMALRFILANNDVHTIIPGMRKVRNVEANIRASDGKKISPALADQLKEHRWDRTPTDWSQ